MQMFGEGSERNTKEVFLFVRIVDQHDDRKLVWCVKMQDNRGKIVQRLYVSSFQLTSLLTFSNLIRCL